MRNIEDSSPASSYLSINEDLKDISVKEMLLNMYNVDFSESVNAKYKFHQKTKQKSVSLEDRRFVSIMENEVKHHDGHYFGAILDDLVTEHCTVHPHTYNVLVVIVAGY